MSERRQDPRVPTSKRGFIKFGAAGTEMPCSVNDLTSNGAGLSVSTSFGVPRVFQLAIDGETGARHCRVIWTDGKKLGVSFE
ncbi:MAG: PilZ domain-containing protein [Pseudolabrys sp.]